MKRIHIAGMAVQVGNVRRQCCAYCGEKLIDEDLELMMVAPGSSPAPAQWYWEPNTLVSIEVNGSMRVTMQVRHPQGEKLPPMSCVYPGGLPPLKLVQP